MPTTITACQSICNADPFCHGFAFNSLTGECELSDSTLSKHVACTECSFSARDCVGKDTHTSHAIHQASPIAKKKIM